VVEEVEKEEERGEEGGRVEGRKDLRIVRGRVRGSDSMFADPVMK
jgi:hypothetical protein